MEVFEIVVTKRVQKWGNRLAFRLPKSFAEELEIGEGTEVDLQVVSGQFVAVPKKLTLDDLMSEITEENRHGETMTGRAEGA